MAQTHEQVIKVWIEPGCIVCDACEAAAPEVFDVQEETCVIHPAALKADFVKPLTPDIIQAAEDCPVEVIKYETVEVEGEAPWAGKEEETAADSTTAAATHKKPALEIPAGPPSPAWAGLLDHAATRYDEDNGESQSTPDRFPVRAPASAIAEAVGRSAPPDAFHAAMVGSGHAQPDRTVDQRLRDRAAAITRRTFVTASAGISVVALAAWAMIGGTFATFGAAFQSFMVPKVTNEPPTTFRAGKLADYNEPGVYESFKLSQNVWVIRLQSGRLVALSTICTHLGCIPNWMEADKKFKCPCHGSGFYQDGVNFEGPAPRPLERLKIYLDGEFVYVDKSKIFRQELGQWELPGAYLEA